MFKKISVALAVALLFMAAALTYLTPTFYGKTNEFTVYRFSDSSSGVAEKVSEQNYPILSATGESFCVDSGKVTPEQIISRYSASLVFTEKIVEGVSYYAYSSQIKRYKRVKGEKVNLHIFVGEQVTVVGSPIIFGSF